MRNDTQRRMYSLGFRNNSESGCPEFFSDEIKNSMKLEKLLSIESKAIVNYYNQIFHDMYKKEIIHNMIMSEREDYQESKKDGRSVFMNGDFKWIPYSEVPSDVFHVNLYNDEELQYDS